jgi:hypothetical protein
MKKGHKKSHKKRVSDKEYKRLLSKKRRTKKENKILKKALNQRYCSCLKAIESNPKLNKNAAFGICARSIFINRGLPVPPEISKSCNPQKTRTRTKKRG